MKTLMLLIFILFIIPLALWTMETMSMNRRAIEAGAAQYNSTTGDFEWIDHTIKYIITGENK